MNLGQMLNQSGAIGSIAQELGVDEGMARTAAGALLPAIVAGMGRSATGGAGRQLGSQVSMKVCSRKCCHCLRWRLRDTWRKVLVAVLRVLAVRQVEAPSAASSGRLSAVLRVNRL